MDRFTNMHAKVLYLRFAAIYQQKFVMSYHDEDFISLWENEWGCGLEDVNVNTIKDALDYCRKNIAWPPSISEFIKICESYDGVPSCNDCIKACMRREFTHPLPLMCYQEIGNWAMTHDTEKALELKFQAAYSQALVKFRVTQENSWNLLETYNARPKELPQPDKIPSNEERRGFKELLAEYQQKNEDAKLQCKGIPYKEFDENKLKKGGKDYDEAVSKEYHDYLIGIPEEQTMILPTKYLYDRNRFLNMNSQPYYLKSVGYVPHNERIQPEEPQRSNATRPTKVYKTWMND